MLALLFLVAWRFPWSLPYAGAWQLTLTSVTESGEVVEPSTYSDAQVEASDNAIPITFDVASSLPFSKIVVSDLSAALPAFTLFRPTGGEVSGELNFGGATSGLRTATGVLDGVPYSVTVQSETELEVIWANVNDKSLKVLRAVKSPREPSYKLLFSGWFGVIILTYYGMKLIPNKLAAPAPEEKEKKKVD